MASVWLSSLKMVLPAVTLGVVSVLMMSAAAHDRGLDNRLASVEAMRDLGKPAAPSRHRSEPERYAATACHCYTGHSALYQGCYPPQACYEIKGRCNGTC
jgi:hypothetical protein